MPYRATPQAGDKSQKRPGPTRDGEPNDHARSQLGSLLTPADVLLVQRSAGNHVAAALVQRQKAQGLYAVTADANLRDDDPPQYTARRTVRTGAQVEVRDNGGRQSNFKAGLVTNEHSWSRWQGTSGWIEDSKLNAQPQAVQAPAPAPPVPAPVPAPAVPAPGPPAPPAAPATVVRLYEDREEPDVRYFSNELKRVADVKVGNNFPNRCFPPRSAAHSGPATRHIQTVMWTEGTRSDHARRCVAAVPDVVENARKAGYDITQAAVLEVLRSLATAVGSIEGTQLGNTQAHYSGMFKS